MYQLSVNTRDFVPVGGCGLWQEEQSNLGLVLNLLETHGAPGRGALVEGGPWSGGFQTAVLR